MNEIHPASLRFQMSIAIDGWSGSGKTTLAVTLSERLRLPVLHTGMMFRSLACIPSGVNAVLGLDTGSAYAALDADQCVSKPGLPSSGHFEWWSPKVTNAVSDVAKDPRARDFVSSWVRNSISAMGPSVVEGRDIGQRVVPEARVKIYLESSEKVLSERSFNSLERNERDRVFLGTTCRPTFDALVIDTAIHSVEAIAQHIVALYVGNEPMHTVR